MQRGKYDAKQRRAGENYRCCHRGVLQRLHRLVESRSELARLSLERVQGHNYTVRRMQK
jgi:hypothetical protein